MDAKTKNEIVQAAQKIIFGQEGNYSSVNANDNGAVSVGKVQWHAGRALALLKKICAAESGAASILGAALYSEITTAAAGAWNARTVNAAEKAAISRLLSTDAGKRVQDAQAEADVGAYVDHGLKVGVEDPAALVYFADLENQGGGGASARVAAAAKKPVTLDTLHAAGVADRVMGKYSTRRKNVYNAAKKLAWSGTASETKGAGSMKASVLIQKLWDIVRNFKTLYVMGCFGAPLTGGNVTRYCQNHEYNRRAERTRMIKAAANKKPPVYGFDCVNLIKGVLWGWSGDASKTYGGAVYKANGVPDTGADGMIRLCKEVSTDFTKILPGEAVWLSGHIGVYVGGGVVIECSPAFKNCVQETACLNIGPVAGMNGRRWTKHGKIPYVTYDVAAETGTQGGQGAAGTPVKPGGTTNTATANAPAVGDVVAFTGNLHYVSANAASGKPCKPGTAKVIGKYNGKHPYQLKAEPGGGSTVYGWVDAADVVTGTAAALAKLAALGVINSPDYWAGVVNSGKVQYLDILLERAAAKIKKAGTRAANVEDGVAALVRAGVIDSPEYWLKNYKQAASLDLLLCALGGAVK